MFIFLVWAFWRAAGLMLIGHGRLETAAVHGRTFGPHLPWRWQPWACLWACRWCRLEFGTGSEMGWDMAHAFYGGGYQYNYWASILVSAGYIGAVMFAERRDWLPELRRRLAAVGRMAFTNYIMHTVICVVIFQGFGGGLYGTTSRLEQTVFILGVWVLQIILSPWWLNRFRYGPLEWLWRSLTYGRMEPFRRSTGEAQG